MHRPLVVITAALCLGVGAAGCSSTSHTTASSTPSRTAGSNAASAAPTSGTSGKGCDTTVVKAATQALTGEKDTMNQALGAAGSSVKVTRITADDACELVLGTDAKPGDPRAEQDLRPLEQGFGTAFAGGQSIKGVKITAADGSVVYQSAATK